MHFFEKMNGKILFMREFPLLNKKNDLKKQIKVLHNYRIDNSISIYKTFSDISSGIDLDRPQFSKLIDLVFENKVNTIYITYSDRLSRLSFLTMKLIFKKFGMKIIVISNNNKENYNELFDEITSIFFDQKYSNHWKNI